MIVNTCKIQALRSNSTKYWWTEQTVTISRTDDGDLSVFRIHFSPGVTGYESYYLDDNLISAMIDRTDRNEFCICAGGMGWDKLVITSEAMTVLCQCLMLDRLVMDKTLLKVVAERRRQQIKHPKYVNRSLPTHTLARAAACYAIGPWAEWKIEIPICDIWPDDVAWDKMDVLREDRLIKAAALCCVEEDIIHG